MRGQGQGQGQGRGSGGLRTGGRQCNGLKEEKRRNSSG